MSDLLRGSIEALIAVSMFVIGQSASDVPASGYLTLGAGVVGLVAIGQMIRGIARAESQAERLARDLAEQLNAAHDEIRDLHELIRHISEREHE